VRFVVVTEAHLSDPTTRENCKSLALALKGVPPEAPLERDAAADTHGEPGTYADLLLAVGERQAMKALAHGHRYFDVHAPLLPTTPITIDFQEHFDAAHFLFAEQTGPSVQGEVHDHFGDRRKDVCSLR
jgi:hypothetical protein